VATTVLTPDQLRAELKQGEIRPVYLLAGVDTFRAERTARWLTRQSLDEANADFNRDTLYADEVPPARIAETAAAFPMFGERRVVWARHAEALPSGAAIAPLLAYLENPSEHTVLLITSSKLDKRLKLTGACAGRGRVVEFGRLVGRDLVAQVGRQAREHRLDLEPAAVQVLVDLVGEDLGELDAELAKLALQDDAEGRRIGPDEVRGLVARSRDVNAFALADALEPARPAEALGEWFALRNAGGDIMGCAAILAWRFRQLAQVRALTAGAGLDSLVYLQLPGNAPEEAVASGNHWCTRVPRAPPTMAPRKREGEKMPPAPPEPRVSTVAASFATTRISNVSMASEPASDAVMVS